MSAEESGIIAGIDRGDLSLLADRIESGMPLPSHEAKLVAALIRCGFIGFTDLGLPPLPPPDGERKERARSIWAFVHVRHASGHRLMKQVLHEAAQRFNVSEATAKADAQRIERVWKAGGDAFLLHYWLEATKELGAEVGVDPLPYLSNQFAAKARGLK